MKLKIECYGNIDHGQNPFELIAKKEINGENIQEIRGKVYDFQSKNQIGGGNWGECPLYLHGVFIGYMSYNGTVWDRSDSDLGRKEEIDDTKF